MGEQAQLLNKYYVKTAFYSPDKEAHLDALESGSFNNVLSPVSAEAVRFQQKYDLVWLHESALYGLPSCKSLLEQIVRTFSHNDGRLVLLCSKESKFATLMRSEWFAQSRGQVAKVFVN